MRNPFIAKFEEVNTTCQEELLEIMYDVEGTLGGTKIDSGDYESTK